MTIKKENIFNCKPSEFFFIHPDLNPKQFIYQGIHSATAWDSAESVLEKFISQVPITAEFVINYTPIITEGDSNLRSYISGIALLPNKDYDATFIKNPMKQ